MTPLLFLPARVLVNGECVAHCSPLLDVAWGALYAFAWIGIAAVLYTVWRWTHR